jgi:inner membrane transporter RhtA
LSPGRGFWRAHCFAANPLARNDTSQRAGDRADDPARREGLPIAITPIGGWSAATAIADPIAIGAGIGVGVASSVIPYVCDQLAMARLSRATYSLLVALLPATATVVGIVVLAQVPSWIEALGVALVVAAVAAHRDAVT